MDCADLHRQLVQAAREFVALDPNLAMPADSRATPLSDEAYIALEHYRKVSARVRLACAGHAAAAAAD
jgi:hypothetical protein